MAHTIELDSNSQRFYQGAATASEVLEAHAATDFPDEDTRIRLFWFYVGAMAVAEHGCTSQADFSHFILGAATRAPQPTQEETA